VAPGLEDRLAVALALRYRAAAASAGDHPAFAAVLRIGLGCEWRSLPHTARLPDHAGSNGGLDVLLSGALEDRVEELFAVAEVVLVGEVLRDLFS
jgi:altronate dehydratase